MATFAGNPAATSIDGTEIVPIAQGGTDKRTTAGDIAALATAATASYDNATSGLAADTVQEAIDEIVASPSSPDAEDVAYDNSTSGLAATDVQAAIDEVAAATGGVSSVNGRTGTVTLTASDVYSTIVTDSTTARSLDADDMGKYLRFTSASAKALTVQDNADEAITTGAEVHGRNAGAGDLTITEDTSVTVNAPAGGTLVIPEGGTFTLKKVATDEWDLFGVTVAA